MAEPQTPCTASPGHSSSLRQGRRSAPLRPSGAGLLRVFHLPRRAGQEQHPTGAARRQRRRPDRWRTYWVSPLADASGASSTLTAIPYGRNRARRLLSVLFLFARSASSSVANTCSTRAPPSPSTV